jgi:uncharacterized membrane protein
MTALFVPISLAVPALALLLVQRQAWAAKAGTIVLCYAAGLLAGNLGLVPAAALPVQKAVSEAAIALALPMILFTVDLHAWSRIAGRALASMALAVLSIVVVAVALFFVLRAQGLPAAYELAGLAVGVYTGGTPNLAAIKTALGIDDTRYLVFNAFDTVVGAAYLMFMVTLAPRLAARWLRPRHSAAAASDAAAADTAMHDEDYRQLLTRAGLAGAAKSLGVAVLVVAAAVGLGQAVGGESATALVITLLATFGLLASLLPQVRGLRLSYKTGMYLIYVFSFAVASMARFDALQWTDLALLVFVVVAVFGSLALHALLARLAGIDAGTFLVTSVSAICSPAFVPLVARSLGSRELLASGIGTGIIGYAVGTQLGIALALLLRQLG